MSYHRRVVVVQHTALAQVVVLLSAFKLAKLMVERTVQPKIKNALLLLPVVLIMHLDCFGVSCYVLYQL